MSRGLAMFLVGVSLAVVGAGAWFWMSRTALPGDLLLATPREATGVAEVRVARILESKAFDQLISQRGHDKGMRDVEQLCGYNPLAQVDDALVFALAPEAGGLPEWGALLRGDLDPRQLAECVKLTFEQHGGKSNLTQDPVENIPCVISSRGDSRACAVSDGLIVGTDRSTRAAIAALLGKAPNAREHKELVGLWKTLDESADVRGVGFVPQDTQNLLRGLVRPFLPANLAPLTDVSGGAGELFMGETVRGNVVFNTPSKDAATEITSQVTRLLGALSDIPALALTPAAGLVRATKVRAQDERVRLEGDYPLHALGTVLDLLPTARRLLMPAAAAALPVASGQPDAGKVRADAGQVGAGQVDAGKVDAAKAGPKKPAK